MGWVGKIIRGTGIGGGGCFAAWDIGSTEKSIIKEGSEAASWFLD
jgi:hypothetical protein